MRAPERVFDEVGAARFAMFNLYLINSCKTKTPPNQHKTRKLSLPDAIKAPTQPLRSIIRRFLVAGLGQNSVSYFLSGLDQYWSKLIKQ